MRTIRSRIRQWLAICWLVAANCVTQTMSLAGSDTAPPESIVSPPATTDSGPPMQKGGDSETGEDVDWEEMRVDWEDLEDEQRADDSVQPTSDNDDWPSGSMVWVLGDDDGIGWFGLENSGILGYWGPLGLHSELGYSILFLEGPQKTDLNPRLYGFHYGVQYRAELDGPWSYEVAVAPGVYSDFEDSAHEGIRIQGHGMGMWTQGALQFVLGIDYLDRENLPLLPIAGVVYEWDNFTRLELVFPKPRISRLLKRELESDRWIYLSADYGGYSWAVERDTGFADVATLNEACILLGTELWDEDGRSSEFELGWHFQRELEFTSGLGSFRPQDTFSIRFGSRF